MMRCASRIPKDSLIFRQLSEATMTLIVLFVDRHDLLNQNRPPAMGPFLFRVDRRRGTNWAACSVLYQLRASSRKGNVCFEGTAPRIRERVLKVLLRETDICSQSPFNLTSRGAVHH